MALQFTPLHPLFAAEVRGLDLRQTPGPDVCAEIDRAMDRYAVLVFRGQELDDDVAPEVAEAIRAHDSVIELWTIRLGRDR